MSIHFIEMYNDDDGDQINEKKAFPDFALMIFK